MLALTVPPPRLISCDESGYTGGDLVNRDQPLFAYAAHDLTAEEAAALVDRIRSSRKRPIQAMELKATGLRKRDDWPEIAKLVLEVLNGRVLTIVMDKRLALAAKAFEYIVEPVIEDNSGLFYRYGLHRLVAAAVYRTIRDADGRAEAIANELKAFMKTFDPAAAPNIFSATPSLPADAVVLKELLRFARGYRDRIDARSNHLRRPSEIGAWVLDLTSASLHSLLAGGLGHRHPRVEVICDESEPLMAMNDVFENWIDRDEAVPMHGGTGMTSWRLNLAKPITFGRSIDHPGLQIADLAAGMAAEIYGAPAKSQLDGLKPLMDRHLHDDHILPHDDPLDPDDPRVRTNLHVLRHLAGRAELHLDPLKGMDELYSVTLKRFRSPAGRIRSPQPRGRRDGHRR